MTFAHLLYALRTRWLSAITVLCLVVGMAAVVTEVLPKKYTATASVLLDVKSTDPILGAGIQALAINGYMATQADVISSESWGKTKNPQRLLNGKTKPMA